MPLMPDSIKVPNTIHKTTRKMVIYVSRDVTTGNAQLIPLALVKSADRSMAVDVTREYALDPALAGEPVEMVIGNLRDLSYRIRKAEKFAQVFEEEVGLADDANSRLLLDQTGAYEIHEVVERPDGTLAAFIAYGCWITDAGATNPSEGNRIVVRDVTFQCAKARYDKSYAG